MEFLKHVGEVILDCLIAELKRVRNLLIGQSFSYQRQHSLFLRRKRWSLHRAGLLWPDFGPIQCSMGEGRIENRVPLEDGAYRLDQQVGVDIFEDISMCAG